jgi:hypothetical protein
MTSGPEDLRELYYEFGRTAEMAQLMETEVGNLALVYATMLIDTSKITDEQREFFRALVEDIDKRTFGDLFRQIEKIGHIDDTILTTVNDALDKRNYLTHRFFRRHNFAIHSVEGRKAMLADLREIQRSLSLAHTMLMGMTGSLSELLAKLLGRSVLSEQEALSLMEKGKSVNL